MATPSYDERNVSDKPAWVRARSPLSWRMRKVLDDRRRQACEALLSVDDMVGTVIDSLASSGRLEDTLIVYMSDNGYLWGEHRIRGRTSLTTRRRGSHSRSGPMGSCHQARSTDASRSTSM